MRHRSNPREKFFHIFGYGLYGRQVTHDMQSDQSRAKDAAFRMINDSLDIVHVAVHNGFFDEYDPQPFFEHYASVPMSVLARDAVGQGVNYYNFWVSPDGEIYPVSSFGHVYVERELIRFRLVPNNEETARSGSSAIAAGWLQISENENGGATFNFKQEPSQRQLDAVFDLVQAHKSHASKWGSRRSELFWRDAMKWLNKPTVTRNPGMGSDWHDGDEEMIEQIVKDEHFGFWLSPDGQCFVVEESWGHAGVADGIYLELTGDHSEQGNGERYLEERGWLRCGDMPRNFGFATGEGTVLTQAQLDVLFDLSRIMPRADTRKFIVGLIKIEIRRRDRGMQKNPDDRFRMVCAWCGAVMVDVPPGPRGEVSHGICAACKKEYEEDNPDIFRESDSDYEIVKRALG